MRFNRIRLITTAIIFSFLSPGPGAFAEAPSLNEETKSICNKVMLDIYQDILKAKDKYKELANFDEKALSTNKHGFHTIVYQYAEVNLEPYAFGLTIDGMDDVTFEQRRDSFQYGFPALGIKISGYQQKHLLRTQYNILPLIQKHGTRIAWHEQEYLPLRLHLRTMKEAYHVRENIRFEVILENVSKRHMLVTALSAETLFFSFNNGTWGAQPFGDQKRAHTSGEKVILRSGESLRMSLKGESFKQPKEFEIQGIYGMRIEGTNPMGTLKIKVIEEGLGQ